MPGDLPSFLSREKAPSAPWLDIAKGDLGTREAPSATDNPAVVSYYAEAGHPEIAHDDVAWCAAFVGAMLARAGYPNTGSLAARSYLNYGTKLERPVPGCIVVFWRGSPTSWEGHVAFYVRDDGTHVRVLGGNQSDAVTEASYPKTQVLGYCWPIAPTVKGLRKAGSAEIATADTLQKAAAGTGAVTVAAEVADKLIPDLPSIPVPDPSLMNAIEHLTLTEKLLGGIRAVVDIMAHSRSALVVGLALAAFAVGWYWKRRRVAKLQSGQPMGVALA